LKKKKIYHNPDIAKYIIVKTKEGDVLRAKRKDPFINEALKEMAAEKYGLSDISQDAIDAVIVFGDPLNSLQFITPGLNQAQGNRDYIMPHSLSLNPITLHSKETVIISLTNSFQISLW
jgi:NAD kinase